MKYQPSLQPTNHTEVAAGLDQARNSLTTAIELLKGDRDLDKVRTWLQLLYDVLQLQGIYGIETALRGAQDGQVDESARRQAAAAVGAAAKSVDDAAGRLIHPKAVRELKRVSEAIGAMRARIEIACPTCEGEAPAGGQAEMAALRKVAAMLMGKGASPKKLAGLQKARNARHARSEDLREAERLAKIRGARLQPDLSQHVSTPQVAAATPRPAPAKARLVVTEV